MRVLIFEWMTSGGLWYDGESPDANCPIQKQGMSMLLAATEDFRQIGHDVVTLLDRRIKPTSSFSGPIKWVESSQSLIDQLKSSAITADAILLIAPESDNCLLQLHDWLTGHESTIISPDRSFVQLTTNKTATADFLRENGVCVPAGSILEKQNEDSRFSFPVVVKPDDGAGSDSIQFAESADEIAWPTNPCKYRIEQYIAGRPASVSVIASDGPVVLLPPTGQCFDAQPIGHYVEADLSLPEDIARRANRLANHCVNALPPTRGYFGIDMVIADDGPEFDSVIEINPRLTCSYVYLRDVVPQNMAYTMLKCVAK